MARIDPRGPLRLITKIEHTNDATLVALACGHIATWAPHCIGQGSREARCFQCGQEAKRSLETCKE